MTLDSLVYGAIIGRCERLERNGVYRGNSHHLAQYLAADVTAALLHDFPELKTAMRARTLAGEKDPSS